MKRIFTLLFSTAILSTAYAQYGQNNQRDRHDDVIDYNNNQGYNKDFDSDERGYGRNGKGYDKYGKSYGRSAFVFTPRDRDMEIAHIEHDYEHKFREIRSRFDIDRYQKKRILYNLEAQRDEEIAMVWRKFKSAKNKFWDYGRRNNAWRW